MKPTFFPKQSDLRNWFKKHHKTGTELIVGYYKVGSGKPSITWSQSVDEALCFGWIDGVRRSIDEKSYQIRFTARRPASIWSAINIKKVESLTKQGLMYPAGLAAFEKRKAVRSEVYTHENDAMKFSIELLKLFRANKKAWAYFQTLAASYKKLSTNWVMNAKQGSTRLKRMTLIIAESEKGTNPWKGNKYKK